MAQIIAVVDDLFFAAKIRGTAEQLGLAVDFPRSLDAILAAAAQQPPTLIVCDLQATRINPVELARHLKADDRLGSIPIIGFFSHVQTELQREATNAGFDRVVPRSVFTRDLPSILSGDVS